MKIVYIKAMADPDLELTGEEDSFVFLALPTFIPSIISSFFTQNRRFLNQICVKLTQSNNLDPTTRTERVYFVYNRNYVKTWL